MDSAQERLLRQLLSIYRCSSCHQRFDRDRFSVLARHDRLWVVSARCSSCQTRQVFWVSLRDGVQIAPHEVTPVEHRRFSLLPAISSDDVLDMHEFLERFDGDFHGLFARRRV